MSDCLPKQPGTYLLGLQLTESKPVHIGKLGCFNFDSGFYYYIGSAFGPGGLYARCGHHIRISHRPRWHIDYLRKNCDLEYIVYSTHEKHLEHQWADQLTQINNLKMPVANFGSSDCQCASHLFFSKQNLLVLSNSIDSILTGSPDIFDLG